MVDFSDLTEEQREDFEERAAIMEYDGGLPREEAEKLALKIIIGERLTDTFAAISHLPESHTSIHDNRGGKNAGG